MFYFFARSDASVTRAPKLKVVSLSVCNEGATYDNSRRPLSSRQNFKLSPLNWEMFLLFKLRSSVPLPLRPRLPNNMWRPIGGECGGRRIRRHRAFSGLFAISRLALVSQLCCSVIRYRSRKKHGWRGLSLCVSERSDATRRYRH